MIIQCISSVDFIRNECIHVEDENTVLMEQISNAMGEEKIDTVFLMGQGLDGLAVQLRAYDINRNYESLIVDEDMYEINNVGFYDYSCDISSFSERNAIVVRQGDNTLDELPNWVADSYTLLSEVSDGYLNYEIWISDSCALDGRSGYPQGTTMSIDILATPGMTAEGVIDENGGLKYDKDGIVFASPGLYSDGKTSYDLTLSFETNKENSSFFELYRGTELLEEIPMSVNEEKLTIRIPNVEGEYFYGVRSENGEGIIKSVQYNAIL